MSASRRETIDLIIRGQRVLLPEGQCPASLHVRDGVIQEIKNWHDTKPEIPIFEAGDNVLMPGLVDIHTHINEPGRTEWEGFQSATRSAAAGGITTLLDMPLNSIPPTTDLKALEIKISAASEKLWVDVGFYGGIVPGNIHSLQPLWESGIVGLKCFICESGVEEFPPVSITELDAALQELKDRNPWVLVHAEAPEAIIAAQAFAISRGQNGSSYETYLRSRPDEAEYQATEELIRLSQRHGARLHIVHLSSATVLSLLEAAKKDGTPITAETCPHYLTFDAESIQAGATEYKCAPPIRSAANRERLWQGLSSGIIDVVATDHSPCDPTLKRRGDGDFALSWGGIASLQLALPAVWTEARRRGIALNTVVQWMCTKPAELADLSSKGSIAIGKDADLICFAPDAEFKVEAEHIYHRHKVTPYLGRTLIGTVKHTFVRGHLVYDQDKFGSEPVGHCIRISK